MDSRCGQYWWQLSVGRPSSWDCTEITFIGGDVLDGPVHTNDTPLMTSSGGVKPKFLEGLSTSEPDCKLAVRGTTSTYKYCDRNRITGDYGTSYPRYQDPLYLPDNSGEFANYPGCQYKGSTRIKFRADGTMQVWSAESRTPSTTAACGGNAPNGARRQRPDRPGHLRGDRHQRGPPVQVGRDRRRAPARHLHRRQHRGLHLRAADGRPGALLRPGQRLHRGHAQGPGHRGGLQQHHRHR